MKCACGTETILVNERDPSGRPTGTMFDICPLCTGITNLRVELKEAEGAVFDLMTVAGKKDTEIANLREVIEQAADCLPEDPLECERILKNAIKIHLSKGEEVTG